MTWAEAIWNTWNDLKSVNWLEWAKVSFDLIKGIGWPLATFSIVFMFRREIRARIPFVRSASVTGIVLDPQEQAQLPVQPIGILGEDHPLKFVQPIEEKLQQELTGISEEKRIPMLVRTLAITQIEREFENIFANIFDTQITFLRRISPAPMDRDQAETYYETVVQPANNAFFEEVPFLDWVDFLQNRNLVIVKADKVSITDLGIDFITFVDVRKPGVQRFN